MTNDTPQLPFFVYGSLLPGQVNAGLWGKDVLAQTPAVLPYGRLYSLGDYPVLIENGEGPVKGMVMTTRPDAYTALLSRLDALEAYNPAAPEESEYLRVIREARSGDGIAVPAWVYIGPASFTPHLPLVPDGDWPAYVAARTANGETKRLRD
ncbi:MAG TPA: gamma-glutamylcyclotransferase [Chloroflexota bacterium]|nr:gamma-glutamylcyclotransferase [Chloroflexota bacterium]